MKLHNQSKIKPAEKNLSSTDNPSHSNKKVARGAPTAIRPEEAKAINQYINAGTAENTRKAYRSAIQHFISWGGLLPTNPTEISRYLVAFASQLSVNTLNLRLAGLSQWHTSQGFDDPTQHPGVKKVISGIRRTHGLRTKKARAIHPHQLHQALDFLRNRHLKGVRDSALIAIGFFGAFRRSELCALRWEHLEWHPQGLLVKLQRSKTDQDGSSITKAIPSNPEENYCPTTLLRQWQTLSGSPSTGFVFRRVDRWGKLHAEAIQGQSINLLIKQIAKDCLWEHPHEYSAHSLRRGLSTSAAKAGASFESIKRQGGWRHDGTVRQYIEEGNLFEENAVNHLFPSTINSS